MLVGSNPGRFWQWGGHTVPLLALRRNWAHVSEHTRNQDPIWIRKHRKCNLCTPNTWEHLVEPVNPSDVWISEWGRGLVVLAECKENPKGKALALYSLGEGAWIDEHKTKWRTSHTQWISAKSWVWSSDETKLRSMTTWTSSERLRTLWILSQFEKGKAKGRRSWGLSICGGSLPIRST